MSLKKYITRKQKKSRAKNDEPETSPETKPESRESILTPHQEQACEVVDEHRKSGVLISIEDVEEISNPDEVETKDDSETAVNKFDVTERDTREENIIEEEGTNIIDDGEKEENKGNAVENRKEEETGPEEDEVDKTLVTDINNEKLDAYEDDNENKGYSESESSRTSRTFDTDDCTITSGYPEVDKGRVEYMHDFLEKNKPAPGLFCGCF